MPKFDVVVIGAGAAGLTAGALLAKNGKKVLVVDREQHLGGRGMAVPFEGYRLNLGGHPLEHGPVSEGMPVWSHGAWRSVRELYRTDKAELKRVIKILCETDFKNLDAYDDRPLREWLLQYTSSEGVIALFEYVAMAECLTERWTDHSAS